MQEYFKLFLDAASLLLPIMLIAWLISIRLKDVSFIDAIWPMGFVLVAGQAYLGITPNDGARLLMACVAIWGLRLGWHLFTRWRRNGPDARYQKILARRENPVLFSLFFVFLLQGLLILIIASPLIVALGDPHQIDSVHLYAGLALWLIGFLFEAIGDWQLERFKANPENAGKVLDTGLWRYTRHPNYFGDACLWWGFSIMAVGVNPHAVWTAYAPVLMTFLLLRWSGVPLLEHGLKKTRPGYENYINQTNAFFPWPPHIDKH